MARFSRVRTEAARRRVGLLAWLLLGVLLMVDFFTGYEITLRFAYTVPISLLVVARGRRLALVMALVADIGWLLSDLASGAQFASILVPIWNLSITFGSYVAIIFLFGGLLALQNELEERVQLRTEALREEVTLREQLERDTINLAENERRSLGNDLHDGLCQHFTATAMAAQLHARRLERDGSASSADAYRVVQLIEDGIGQTRRLARGLVLMTVEVEGLSVALKEMTVVCTQQFRVKCTFEEQGLPVVDDVVVATYLFRIAQEAVRNAVRHGKASEISVSLSGDESAVKLVVDDNGSGLPPPENRGSGMGLRIMAHRAAAIGAQFAITSGTHGGTTVKCDWHSPVGES